ncbi:MAG TPA: polyprenyl synthetase family protein [Deinococcales bacterium]|nr:polyprenyl synthetase family protein [Deinococcales bacterium]
MLDTVNEYTRHLLPGPSGHPELSAFYSMLRDYPERGGKGLRAQLLLLSARAHGGREERAVPLAAALELFQNWVLIHDDVEDDSDERRGRPALHRLHGAPLAINAGDALHVLMWKAVLEAEVPGAAGEFLETVFTTAEGQHLDLSWIAANRWDVTPADYEDMVRRKTARYTVVSPLRLGALAAGRDPDPALSAAGLDLGVAFQIRDDVLNLTGSFADYGKEIGGDLWEGKRTLILSHYLAGLGEETRAAEIALLSRPRALKDPPAMAALLERVKASGAVAAAQAVADERAARGLETLRGALAGLPDPAAAGQILALAEQLAQRTA